MRINQSIIVIDFIKYVGVCTLLTIRPKVDYYFCVTLEVRIFWNIQKLCSNCQLFYTYYIHNHEILNRQIVV